MLSLVIMYVLITLTLTVTAENPTTGQETVDAVRLQQLERHLLAPLESYISEIEDNLHILEELKHHKDRAIAQAKDDQDKYIGNPVNLILLIKRFTGSWTKLGDFTLTENPAPGKQPIFRQLFPCLAGKRAISSFMFAKYSQLKTSQKFVGKLRSTDTPRLALLAASLYGNLIYSNILSGSFRGPQRVLALEVLYMEDLYPLTWVKNSPSQLHAWWNPWQPSRIKAGCQVGTWHHLTLTISSVLAWNLWFPCQKGSKRRNRESPLLGCPNLPCTQKGGFPPPPHSFPVPPLFPPGWRTWAPGLFWARHHCCRFLGKVLSHLG